MKVYNPYESIIINNLINILRFVSLLMSFVFDYNYSSSMFHESKKEYHCDEKKKEIKMSIHFCCKFILAFSTRIKQALQSILNVNINSKMVFK